MGVHPLHFRIICGNLLIVLITPPMGRLVSRYEFTSSFDPDTLERSFSSEHGGLTGRPGELFIPHLWRRDHSILRKLNMRGGQKK
jgi:hypothetical protein